jgi:hypothetical protein
MTARSTPPGSRPRTAAEVEEEMGCRSSRTTSAARQRQRPSSAPSRESGRSARSTGAGRRPRKLRKHRPWPKVSRHQMRHRQSVDGRRPEPASAARRAGARARASSPRRAPPPRSGRDLAPQETKGRRRQAPAAPGTTQAEARREALGQALRTASWLALVVAAVEHLPALKAAAFPRILEQVSVEIQQQAEEARIAQDGPEPDVAQSRPPWFSQDSRSAFLGDTVKGIAIAEGGVLSSIGDRDSDAGVGPSGSAIGLILVNKQIAGIDEWKGPQKPRMGKQK